MKPSPRMLTVVLTVSALACSTLVAQPTGGNTGKGGYRNGQGTGQAGGDYDRFRDKDEGTEYGFVSAVRVYGAKNSAKLGSITVRTQNGRQVSAALMDRTRYTLGGAEMDRAQVGALLVKGTPVVMQWRYSNDTGGRAAYSIEVRTVAMHGTIKKFAGKHITVLASPTQSEAESEPQAPQIKAGGRPMAPPAKRVAPKPVVRTVTLLFNKDVSKVTVDGEKADRAGLKPNVKFDAVVMDGGSNLILEIHVKTKADAVEGGSDKDGADKAGGSEGGGTEKKRPEPGRAREGKPGK